MGGKGKKHYKCKTKERATKRRTRDIDQVHNDLKEIQKFKVMPVDEDLPGEGQFYCVSCAHYCQDDVALQVHFKTKMHKRVLKEARKTPHTQEDAEAAGEF